MGGDRPYPADGGSIPTAPSLTLLGLEPVRAVLEYVGAHLMDRR